MVKSSATSEPSEPTPGPPLNFFRISFGKGTIAATWHEGDLRLNVDDIIRTAGLQRPKAALARVPEDWRYHWVTPWSDGEAEVFCCPCGAMRLFRRTRCPLRATFEAWLVGAITLLSRAAVSVAADHLRDKNFLGEAVQAEIARQVDGFRLTVRRLEAMETALQQGDICHAN